MRYLVATIGSFCLISGPSMAANVKFSAISTQQHSIFTPELFAACDSDQSGDLSVEELFFCLDENDNTESIFACADTDGNGKLSYEETLTIGHECPI